MLGKKRAVFTLVSSVALVVGGAAFVLASQQDLWATQLGVALCIIWIIGRAWWSALRADLPALAVSMTQADAEVSPLHALLDQVPVPLICVDGTGAHAINRAARRLFATDDRILPAPPELLDRTADRMGYEGRNWRIDAVDLVLGERLAVLLDVEAEARVAEDRANEEMIEILGHELINGLSPIVSLADSALTAAAHGDVMLPDILATLARRVEGLEGFTRTYRTLSRLPDPVLAPISLRQLADDLNRLFVGRFRQDVALVIDGKTDPDRFATADRDQLIQAIWALLQNGAEAALATSAPRRVMLTMMLEGGGLTVQVRDSGEGIPVGERVRIFRPFHTTKQGGSGVGLSLARRIARAHGGDVFLLPTNATIFQMQISDH
mgnify:CR=1 FL=1